MSMWVEKGQVSNSERMVGLGSIRPICRAIGEDPICALLPLILRHAAFPPSRRLRTI